MANNEQFARSLSLLRRERGLSQRAAAGALGVSQALLSHYENGVREPGLAFVVKACDFYGVSADFLLGRSMSRDGTTILDAGSLYDAAGERDNILRGSVVATLSKKLLVNSVSVIFDLLGKTGDKRVIRAASDYLGAAVYTLFRHMYSANPENSRGFFSTPDRRFLGGAGKADLILSELELTEALADAGEGVPAISNDALSRDYPGTYQSLLQVVHTAGTRINRQLKQREEK